MPVSRICATPARRDSFRRQKRAVKASGGPTMPSASQIGYGLSSGLPADEHEIDHARPVATTPAVSGGPGGGAGRARRAARKQERQRQSLVHTGAKKPPARAPVPGG